MTKKAPARRRSNRPKGAPKVTAAEPISKPRANTLEAKEPELAGQIIADMQTDPEITAGEIAQKLGISKSLVEGFMRRVKTRYLGLKEELYRVDNKGIQDLIDDRAYRLLQYLDEDLMSQGNLRDITYALDRVFNMRQLLKGEPTAILGIEDRKQLNQLVPLMLQEAQRRGIVMDGDYEVVPGEPEP